MTDKSKTDFEFFYFPEDIGERDSRRLIKYLYIALKGNSSIQLNTFKNEGIDYTRQTLCSELEDIRITKASVSLEGKITRKSDKACVEFFFLPSFNKSTRTFFNGVQLIPVYNEYSDGEEKLYLSDNFRRQIYDKIGIYFR